MGCILFSKMGCVICLPYGIISAKILKDTQMPSLANMRTKAKEAGLMKLDRLIEKRQHVPTNEFPIPVKELCERFERLYTGCVNDVLREACLLDQNLPHDIMPLRDEMTVAARRSRSRAHRTA
jgi:hypothetical protein